MVVQLESFGGTQTTDASGDASATSETRVAGIIKAIRVDLGTATSVDVKITPTNNTDTNSEILNKTSIAADNIYYIKKQSVDKGASDLSNEYSEYVNDGQLTLTIANGGNAKTVKVTVYYV